ncbi:hypothetical protein RI054_10g51610 [Pseudoscourfieldia marina]
MSTRASRTLADGSETRRRRARYARWRRDVEALSRVDIDVHDVVLAVGAASERMSCSDIKVQVVAPTAYQRCNVGVHDDVHRALDRDATPTHKPCLLA